MEIEICDYREDKVINGVLCYAVVPLGCAPDSSNVKWIEYTKEELTDMYLGEQEAFDAYIDRIIEGDVVACGGELL